jgi:hypothetical protein
MGKMMNITHAGNVFPTVLLLARVALAVLLLLPFSVLAEGLHSGWDSLLSVHVVNGKVDYQGFKQDEKELDTYLAILDTTRPDSLTDNEQIAYYINAYNAYTVKLILDNFKNGKPVKSIKGIGGLFSSPWSIRFVKLGGERMTLDTLEHDILRRKFKEARVHFAVNCASTSCPPLLSEAYVAENIERQLENNTIDFLHNREFNYISGNTLYLSKIFSWFSEDFNDDPAAFVKKYARGDLLAALEAAGDSLRVKYLDYDWSLNSR